MVVPCAFLQCKLFIYSIAMLYHYCYISLYSYTSPLNSVHFFCLFSLFYIWLKQIEEEQLKQIINGDKIILLNIMVYSTNLHEVYIQLA